MSRSRTGFWAIMAVVMLVWMGGIMAAILGTEVLKTILALTVAAIVPGFLVGLAIERGR